MTNQRYIIAHKDSEFYNGSGGGGSSIVVFKGSITIPSDFPTPQTVQNGWSYIIQADVTDNDPTRTNTGQSFTAGTGIIWDGSAWVIGYDATNMPTADQKAAMDWADSPSSANAFITKSSGDYYYLSSSYPYLPTMDEKAALDNSSNPSAENEFLTKSAGNDAYPSKEGGTVGQTLITDGVGDVGWSDGLIAGTGISLTINPTTGDKTINATGGDGNISGDLTDNILTVASGSSTIEDSKLSQSIDLVNDVITFTIHSPISGNTNTSSISQTALSGGSLRISTSYSTIIFYADGDEIFRGTSQGDVLISGNISAANYNSAYLPTANQKAALDASSNPSSSNALQTKSATDTAYVSKTGGTLGQVPVTNSSGVANYSGFINAGSGISITTNSTTGEKTISSTGGDGNLSGTLTVNRIPVASGTDTLQDSKITHTIDAVNDITTIIINSVISGNTNTSSISHTALSGGSMRVSTTYSTIIVYAGGNEICRGTAQGDLLVTGNISAANYNSAYLPTANQKAALDASSNPSSSNAYQTKSATDATYVPKTGGTLGQSPVTNNVGTATYITPIVAGTGISISTNSTTGQNTINATSNANLSGTLTAGKITVASGTNTVQDSKVTHTTDQVNDITTLTISSPVSGNTNTSSIASTALSGGSFRISTSYNTMIFYAGGFEVFRATSNGAVSVSGNISAANYNSAYLPTANQKAALDSSASPSSSNPYQTKSATDTAYVPKTGGTLGQFAVANSSGVANYITGLIAGNNVSITTNATTGAHTISAADAPTPVTAYVNNTAFIDPYYGNDITGVLNSPSKPFWSTKAAYDAITFMGTVPVIKTNPFVIRINPGTYYVDAVVICSHIYLECKGSYISYDGGIVTLLDVLEDSFQAADSYVEICDLYTNARFQNSLASNLSTGDATFVFKNLRYYGTDAFTLQGRTSYTTKLDNLQILDGEIKTDITLTNITAEFQHLKNTGKIIRAKATETQPVKVYISSSMLGAIYALNGAQFIIWDCVFSGASYSGTRAIIVNGTTAKIYIDEYTYKNLKNAGLVLFENGATEPNNIVWISQG